MVSCGMRKICEVHSKQKNGERKENTDCYKNFQRIFRNSSKCGILHWAQLF